MKKTKFTSHEEHLHDLFFTTNAEWTHADQSILHFFNSRERSDS